VSPEIIIANVRLLHMLGQLTDEQALCLLSAPYNTPAEHDRLLRLVLERCIASSFSRRPCLASPS
jgi:hypothetical protein